MTAKTDFTEEEWRTVLEGPPSAGVIVTMAQRGGTIRETFAIGKAYAEARQKHGASRLLDDIVAAKPEVDRTHYGSVGEMTEHGLGHLRDAMAVLKSKASPEEVAEYRGFVLTLAKRVAGAHEEDGARVSPAEQAAIDRIADALNGATV